MYYVGNHINTSHGFVSCAKYAFSLDNNFFQIFLTSPRSYKNKRHTENELLELTQEMKIHNNMKCVIHGSYLLNFCNINNHTKGIELLISDLNDSVKLGAIGVIIHMGSKLKLSVEEAINNYVKGVKEALSKSNKNSVLILETGAGDGTEICTSLPDLRKLYDLFDNEERKRIKFCIDTCHVFSAGHDLSNIDYIDKFDKLIKDTLTWDLVACVHLNDSKAKCGGKRDCHADLTKGHIKEDGLKKFVNICVKNNVPMVLETPCDSDLSKEQQVKLVKGWINK